jgi:hypothetical protein
MDNTTLRDKLENKYAQLRNERVKSWDAPWMTLRDNIDPDTGRFPDELVNDGGRKDQRIINNTATISAGVLAAGMQSGMTSPARPWFELAAPDPAMSEFAPVKNWLWFCQNAMREVFVRSNLYNVLPSCYGEQGVFGTGVIAAIPDDRTLVRFYNFTIGSYYLATSNRSLVDTLYRDMSMTPRQMAQQFGVKNLSASVKAMLDNNSEAWVQVCHAIEPNDTREPGRMDNKNMPYRSVYWEKASSRNEILKSSGLKKFPIMAPRWKVTGESVYGKGPGSFCIGEVLALQILERDKLELLKKGVKPPMSAPASMRGTRVSVVPGDVTWVPDAQVGGKFAPLYEINPAWLGQLRGEIQASESRIKTTFYEDLFLMISNMDTVRTATEIATRKEEKMLMLGPVLERQNDELLDPLIDITFQMMLEQSIPRWQGLLPGKPILPPPPQELQGMDLSVEYVSILAQAQKALGVTAIERALAFTGNLAASFPQAADMLNVDQTCTEYFDAIGVPPTMLNSPDQVAAIRQARADAAAQAQQQAQVQQVVEGAKLLSETDTSGQNALTQLASMQQ